MEMYKQLVLCKVYFKGSSPGIGAKLLTRITKVLFLD